MEGRELAMLESQLEYQGGGTSNTPVEKIIKLYQKIINEDLIADGNLHTVIKIIEGKLEIMTNRNKQNLDIWKEKKNKNQEQIMKLIQMVKNYQKSLNEYVIKDDNVRADISELEKSKQKYDELLSTIADDKININKLNLHIKEYDTQIKELNNKIEQQDKNQILSIKERTEFEKLKTKLNENKKEKQKLKICL